MPETHELVVMGMPHKTLVSGSAIKEKLSIPFRPLNRRFDRINVMATQGSECLTNLFDGLTLQSGVTNHSSLAHLFPTNFKLELHQNDNGYVPVRSIFRKRS